MTSDSVAGLPALPAYTAKVLAALAVHGFSPGELLVVDILHDDDCPLLLRGGPCRCDADVRIVSHLRPAIPCPQVTP